MEFYRSTCPDCHHETFWKGASTYLVKTSYPVCIKCGCPTNATHRKPDRATLLGQFYYWRIAKFLS